MARRRSSEEKLLFFLFFEFPFHAIRLSLLLLGWTVQVAVWVFSVASELVASSSNKRELKNPVHELVIWPIRRNDPFQLLVVWLLGIWLSVLYIYIAIDPDPVKKHESTAAVVPLSNSTGPLLKHKEQPIKSEDRGKQKKTVANSSSLPTKPAKRANKDIPESFSGPRHEASPSIEKPIDGRDNSEQKIERAEAPTEIASLPPEKEVASPRRQSQQHKGSSYLAIVQRRIINEWHPPSISERMEVVVGFKLSRSGRISDISVEHSSGNEYFDLAATRAVVAADPLPVFPQGFEDDEMTTHIRFSNES